MSFLSDLISRPPGVTQLSEGIFGRHTGDMLTQLPLDSIVMPVTGAMAATGPKSYDASQHLLKFLYGNNVPSDQTGWINWNTRLQPKPAQTTQTPMSGGGQVIQPIGFGGS